MGRDRWLLISAYVLLVLVVAWSSWRTERTLDRIEEDVCAVAEVAVAAPLLNIAVYGQQEGVNPDAAVLSIETLVSIAELIQNRCGRIFLDAIEVQIPDIEIPPLTLEPPGD